LSESANKNSTQEIHTSNHEAIDNAAKEKCYDDHVVVETEASTHAAAGKQSKPNHDKDEELYHRFDGDMYQNLMFEREGSDMDGRR
jgi:hypothetical protein